MMLSPNEIVTIRQNMYMSLITKNNAHSNFLARIGAKLLFFHRIGHERNTFTAYDHPRPTNGIFVAMIVMKSTLASSGRLAMCTMALATCATSIRGSIAVVPLA
jgi:hypothetical protein